MSCCVRDDGAVELFVSSSIYGVRVRKEEVALAKIGSCKGRAYCLLAAVVHPLLIVASPLLLIASAIITLFFGVLGDCCCSFLQGFANAVSKSNEKIKHEVWDKTVSLVKTQLACIPIAPFAQILLTLRAVAGAFFHPRAYFTPVIE